MYCLNLLNVFQLCRGNLVELRAMFIPVIPLLRILMLYNAVLYKPCWLSSWEMIWCKLTGCRISNDIWRVDYESPPIHVLLSGCPTFRAEVVTEATALALFDCAIRQPMGLKNFMLITLSWENYKIFVMWTIFCREVWNSFFYLLSL